MSWVETLDAALKTPSWAVTLALLSVLGSVASLVSMGIAIYVAYAVQRHDRRFKRLALLPTYNERLKNCLKSLENAVKRKNEQRLRAEISRVKSILRQIREFAETDLRGDIDVQIEVIQKLITEPSDPFNAQINAAVGRLSGVVESCIDLEIRIPWRHPDEG